MSGNDRVGVVIEGESLWRDSWNWDHSGSDMDT